MWQEARTSSRYALAKIRVAGVQQADHPGLLARLQGFRGQNLFALDLPDVARTVAVDPWVRQASVRRILPNAIEVQVEERTPYAQAVWRGRIMLVDREAVVLGPGSLHAASGADYDLPVITGISLAATTATAAPDPGSLEHEACEARKALLRGIRALAAVHDIAPEMLDVISEVNVRAESHVRLVLRSPQRTLWLSEERTQAGLLKYLKVEAAMVNLPPARHIDLRFRNRVVVRAPSSSEHPEGNEIS